MGYKVIARRWRPRHFEELVGQDHIVKTLENAILKNRIAHAYLFVGPRGTGKTSTARLFAKALNAEGGPSIKPNNESMICKSIMDGSCMDVIEIDGASNNSVDQIRSLREECQYAPSQCAFKIYIIDEVHMLTTAAFNALLKTLEEPPSHVKFIFATTESNKVLPTISSRCQRFEFRPISEEIIAEKLSKIAKEEKIDIDKNALSAISRLANGGMRDSQSILDQMISFCGEKIMEKDVLEVYGIVGISSIRSLATAMAELNYSSIIKITEEFISEGRDLLRILNDLIIFFKEILLDSINNNGLSNILNKEMTTSSLMRMVDALQRGEYSIAKSVSERSSFEILLLKSAEESRSLEIDTILDQIVSFEKKDEKKNNG